MGRQQNISKAILRAVHDEEQNRKTILKRILYFFNVINISLARYHGEDFYRLRRQIWELDEKLYRQSFDTTTLKSVGDLGYSGSTFFTTEDSKYLIKSIPRRSEYEFFALEMLDKYVAHNMESPSSLLVRITDFLHAPNTAIGSILRITPSHHIIMENILYGKEADPMGDKWETYDLKPVSYFYPERDIAGGRLASDSVKERLLDTFEDKVRVSKADMDELLDQLASDTRLLQDCNVVDYSLFLVRYPTDDFQGRNIPTANAKTSPWRAGVKSYDGKWIYRAVVLDFFWAKHKLHAKTMTALIKSFNLISRKGHMSITTNSGDYRKRFLQMVSSFFELET